MGSEKKKLLLAIACCTAATATPTFAQELEEIVITTQRRAESLQDVPISVSAVTGETMLEYGFSDVEDMAAFVPNLFIEDGFTGQRMQIRGIGTSVGNEAFEQAVAQFNDGIYYGRDDLSQNAVFDVERIEVVRGPQPTFAGQSATAGAINTISRRPGDVFSARILAAYGNNDETNAEFGVTIPVTDTFALRASGRYNELADTGYKQYETGADIGYQENQSYRLIGVWEPADTVSVEFKYEYQDVFRAGTPDRYVRCDTDPATSFGDGRFLQGFGAACAIQALYYNDVIGGDFGYVGEGGFLDIWDATAAIDARNGLNPGDPGAWTPAPGTSNVYVGADNIAEFNTPPERSHQADIGKIGIDWDIGDLTLSLVSGFVQYDKYHVMDPDSTVFPIFRAGRKETFEQKSQEIRLTSPDEDRFSWMAGLYWQNTDIDSHLPVYTAFGTPLGAASGFAGDLLEDATWKSFFFSTNYDMNDNWRLNVGGRYQKVEKDGLFAATYAPVNAEGTAFQEFRLYPPIPRFARASVEHPLKNDASEFLPEVGIQWDATDDMMFYAKYAEAFKAGGFVVGPSPGGGIPNNLTYEPEYAEGFELGMKATVLDGRMRLNVAIFDTDYSDLQVTQQDQDTNNFETVNAAKANTKGIEVDGRIAITDNFSLGFGGSVIDAKFTDYPNGGDCDSLQDKLWQLEFPGTSCLQDLTGVTLPNVPEMTFQLAPEYQFGLGSNYLGRIVGTAVFNGTRGSTSIDPHLLKSADSNQRVDLRFSVEPLDGNWTLAFYGRNIFDDRTCGCGGGQVSGTTVLDYDAGTVTYTRRRVGVQFTYSFGD